MQNNEEVQEFEAKISKANVQLQFVVDAFQFKTAIGKLKLGIENKIIHPILGQVLVTYENNQIKFQTTNLQLWVSVNLDSLGCSFSETDAINLQFDKLQSIAKVITKKKGCKYIRFVQQDADTWKAIMEGGTSVTINALGKEDFPVPQVDITKVASKVVLIGSELKAATQSVRYATNPDSYQEIDTVINLHVGEKILVQATNRAKVAIARIFSSSKESFDISSPYLDKITKIMSDDDVTVGWSNGENHWAIISDINTSVITRICENQYPDLLAIISVDKVKVMKIRFNTSELQEFISDAIAVVGNKNTDNSFVKFVVNGEIATVTVTKKKSMDIPLMSKEIDCFSWTKTDIGTGGEDFKMLFRLDTLGDTIKAHQEDYTVFEYPLPNSMCNVCVIRNERNGEFTKALAISTEVN